MMLLSKRRKSISLNLKLLLLGCSIFLQPAISYGENSTTISESMDIQISVDLKKVSGDNQIGPPGQVLSKPFIIKVTNSKGMVITDLNNNHIPIPVTFKIISQPSGATGAGLSPNNATEVTINTNSNGEAKTILTLGNKNGIYKVEVTSNLVTEGSPQVFTAYANPIKVDKIWFDYQGGNAIDIRKNYTEEVKKPEFDKAASRNEPACYVKNTQIKIKVQFITLDTNVTSATIWATGGLGGIGVKNVNFSGGSSNEVEFTANNALPNYININNITFHWKCKDIQPGGAEEMPIMSTTHKIYTVLATPKEPMAEPWTEVLDYACNWAKGQTSAVEAATAITEKVNAVSNIKYDMDSGASSYTGWNKFYCTDFLDRLQGGSGRGAKVNCTDCGTIVTNFANALGCQLWSSRMGYYFGLNKIIAIGYFNWGCPNWGCVFSYHEFAWGGDCEADDHLWDACLKVDGDNDPTSSPHTPLLPCNMVYDLPSSTDYEERLVVPSDLDSTNPDPSTKKRRTAQ